MALIRDEYEVLTDKLEELDWALEGECDDIDCNRYMYKDMVEKRYPPVLEHNYSCVPNLRRDREAVMRLLSAKKFRRYRIKKCHVCKRPVDKLGKEFDIVSFIRPTLHNKRKAYQWDGVIVHKKCSKKTVTLEGWQKFN